LQEDRLGLLRNRPTERVLIWVIRIADEGREDPLQSLARAKRVECVEVQM
jgi:hypothetical protein